MDYCVKMQRDGNLQKDAGACECGDKGYPEGNASSAGAVYLCRNVSSEPVEKTANRENRGDFYWTCFNEPLEIFFEGSYSIEGIVDEEISGATRRLATLHREIK